MMRRLFGILLYVIAGFFFYTVSVLSFINDSPAELNKWWFVLGFTIPALVTLCGGLALNGFRKWKRVTGIILLTSSGFTAFIVFTFACLMTNPEFLRMSRPEAIAIFSDYSSGALAILCFAILGSLLLKLHHTDEK